VRRGRHRFCQYLRVIRRSATLLLTLVCLFALASCGADGGDRGAGSGTTDGIPAYALGDTPASAQKFVGYWVDTLNEATTSGDTAQLRKLSTDACKLCTDFIQRLDTIYADGGHVETEGFSLKSTTMEGGFTADHAGMIAVLDSAPQTVVEEKDAQESEHAGGPLRFRFVLDRANDHWVVTDLIPS
jgi:hypothetical protein